MKKKTVIRVLALAVTLLLTACSGQGGAAKPQSETTAAGQASDTQASAAAPAGGNREMLSLSHTNTAESPWELASLALAKSINEHAANQRYEVKTFPNGQLIQKNWKVMIEMIQSGSTVFGIESITALASEVPELGSVQLPFLFKNDAHIQAFFASDDPLLQKWYEKFEEKNMVVLAIAPRKFRQLINNKHIIKTPDDIAGMKFRVPDNPFFVRVFELMGAKPVPLPSGEIYSAIQLGTVSGEDNSVSVVYDFKTHEVAKNMTIWNYMGDASLVVMNKTIWDQLSDDEKAAFKAAGQEWVKVYLAEEENYQQLARTKMTEAGVQFYDMPDAEKEPFKALMQPIYDETKAKIGEADYEALMALVEKTAP